jgi:hypothetical protein
MRLEAETRAKGPQGPEIDSLSRLMDGPRAQPKAPFRLAEWGVLVSALGHAILFYIIIWVTGVVQLIPAANESVEVEMVLSSNPAAPSPGVTGKPLLPPPMPGSNREVTTAPAAETPTANPATKSTMTKATEMLSEAMLSDPRGRGQRQVLAQMDAEDRAAQLCSIEAMGQITKSGGQFMPELVSSYAMSPIRLNGSLLIAEGAAFQSNGNWYNLAFRCRVSPDRTRVQSFEFAIGDPIPKSKWPSHNLTSLHGWHSVD